MAVLIVPLIMAVATIVPVALLAALRVSIDPLYAGLAASFVLLHEVGVRLPSAAGVHVGHWNWVGKGLGIAISLIWMAVSGMKASDFGIVLPSRAGWLLAVPLILLGATLCLLTTARHSGVTFSWETLAFQALIPSLDEELAFRGVLYAYLFRSLRESRVGGEATVFTVALVSLLFSLDHGVVWSKGRLLFKAHPLLESLVPGLFMTTARGLTGSVLPGMAIHSVDNVLTYLLRL